MLLLIVALGLCDVTSAATKTRRLDDVPNDAMYMPEADRQAIIGPVPFGRNGRHRGRPNKGPAGHFAAHALSPQNLSPIHAA